MMQVPVIDLSAPDRAAVAAAVDDALPSVGFLAVTGHGVDPALVEEMFAAVAALFALPLAEKLAATAPEPGSPRGYSRLGSTAQADAHDEHTEHDLAETFNAGLEPVPDTDYHRAAADFFRPNVWPAASAGRRDVWDRYRVAMQALADRLLGLMGEALGLAPDHFAPLIDRPMASITANHYPRLEHEPAPNQYRGGAHTDYGTITLLATDGVPGLELQDGDGRWVPTEPVPGAFHVNTGDMLSMWSGGHWRSTWHRVVPPPGGPPYPERTSIAYFHSPNADALIAPLPGREADGFEPVVAGPYLRAKIARYHSRRSS